MLQHHKQVMEPEVGALGDLELELAYLLPQEQLIRLLLGLVDRVVLLVKILE